MRLEDRTAKARLVRRFERLADGYTDDHRFLGAALFELRARQMIEQLESRK
jgi:putative component of toxin-antitoxin plasmid stabilization module